MSDNDKERKFKYEIHIGVFEDTGEIAVRDNITDMVIGMGMCEMAKNMIKSKIIQSQQKKVAQAHGGIMNFARKFKR